MNTRARHLNLLIAWAVAVVSGASQGDVKHGPDAQAAPARVWSQSIRDPRLENVRTLYQGSGFRPYTDSQAWQTRAADLRQQVLMAAGLWPLPEKCDLKPVIHGRIDRGDYTVEKVFFQSHPGFYVTGNLYRPKGKTGPFPGVLCPHGHWNNGRFYQNSDSGVAEELKNGTEKDADAARYPLQARCANLAKLGCVVFHYDMVGYADAHADLYPHRQTFTDAASEMRSQNIFGLQTWNSIRSLDFLQSLPDVDSKRLACTGASGGGTQTFVLMVVDDRLTAAAPVCMISAGDHQGGCVCENSALLRVGTDNVEFAACFAPRPLVHPTATGDWTKEFMEKGLPELKAIYRLFGAEEKVHAVRFNAGHNYNLNSRETVYNWFNRHLGLGHASEVREQKFQPVPPKELSVFNAEYPRPADAVSTAALSRYLSDVAAKQVEALRPKDPASLDRYRTVMGAALRHMIFSQLPAQTEGAVSGQKVVIRRGDGKEELPGLLLAPPSPSGAVTVVIHPDGKAGLFNADGKPAAMLAGLLEKGQTVLAMDVFLTGELRPSTMPEFPPAKVEFFAGYNRTTLANRVHDILTAVAYAKSRPGTTAVNLVGVGKAGAWCLLARAAAGDAIARTAVDTGAMPDFDAVKARDDENYLPGAVRFGGIWPLAALAAPGELLLFNCPEMPSWLASVYQAAGAKESARTYAGADAANVIRFVTR